MFSFFKKRPEPFEVSAPIAGKLMRLEEVNDPVFSQKMMGDGFAVSPEAGADTVTAPVSGEVVMVPDSKHAVGLKTAGGVEVLVHIGIDTVDLNGQGFTAFIKKGDKVRRGDKLIKFDPAFMKDQDIDMTVMTIFTAGYEQLIALKKAYESTTNPSQVLLD